MDQADAGAESDRDADMDEATHSPKQWKVLPTIAFTFFLVLPSKPIHRGGWARTAYKK